jgi:hypothetical protein
MVAQLGKIVLNIVGIFLDRIGRFETGIDAERRHARAVEARLELVNRERADKICERRSISAGPMSRAGP